MSLEEKMKKELEIDMEQEDFEEINELILDGLSQVEITEVDKAYLEQFVNLAYLSFNLTKMKSLANFPNLSKLTILELNDNSISGEQLKHLSHLDGLEKLKLSNNNIKNIEDLDPLIALSKLKSLDLTDCKVSDSTEKTQVIFELLPQLEILNGFDKNGTECLSEEEGDLGESEEEDYDGEEESDSEVEEILGKRKSKELPAHDEEHLLEGEDDEDEDDESIGDEGPLRKLRTGDDDSEEEKGEGLEVVSSEEEEVEVPKPAKPVQQGKDSKEGGP